MIIGIETEGLRAKLQKDLDAGASALQLMQTIKAHSMGRVVPVTKADVVKAVFHEYANDLLSYLPDDIWAVVTHFPEKVIEAVMDVLEDPWSGDCTLENALFTVKYDSNGMWTYYDLCEMALDGAGIEIRKEEE